MTQPPDCPAPRTDGPPSRRLQSLIDHLRCDESLNATRNAIRDAARGDGVALLSYKEYKEAGLSEDTRNLFNQLERGLTQGFNSVLWWGADRAGVIDRELGRINTILGQNQLPLIDRAFVDEAVRRRAR